MTQEQAFQQWQKLTKDVEMRKDFVKYLSKFKSKKNVIYKQAKQALKDAQKKLDAFMDKL